MIIETRRWQFVMFILGIVCVFVSLKSLFGFHDVYINICLKKGSQFYYYLNQTLLALLLVVIGVVGILLLYTVINSIKKCHEFRKYETKPFTIRKTVKMVIGNIVIILLFFVIFFSWDHVFSPRLNERQENFFYRTNIGPSQVTPFKCTILDYKKRDKGSKGEWIGKTTLRIESPKKYKGKIVIIKVFRSTEGYAKLQKKGETITFYVRNDEQPHQLSGSNMGRSIFRNPSIRIPFPVRFSR